MRTRECSRGAAGTGPAAPQPYTGRIALRFAHAEGDGPLEGTDGRSDDTVVEALDGEAPGGAGEPPRAAGDRRRLHDGDDAGGRRGTGFAGELGGQRVAVGRGELVVPGRGPGREVHEVRDGHL